MSKLWTEEEIDILTKLRREGSSAEEIAISLGRTESSVYESTDITNRVRVWSKQEDIYLIDNYKNNSIEELSNSLGRSISSIKNRVHILGIKKGKSKSPEQFLLEVKNKFPNIEVIGTYTTAKTKVLVKYVDCGHTAEIEPDGLLSSSTNSHCRICFPKIRSRGEIELEEYLKSLGLNTVHSVRNIIHPLEIDIFIPDHLLGIEYNGEVWHSDKFKEDSENYHLNKLMLANNAAIDLIHIWSHEWNEKNAIVKSRLKSILGLNQKIFARKTTLKTISWAEAKEFLDRCHLQGGGAATKINLGLYHENNLVAVMTFSTPRFNKNYQFELVRYCSDLNTNVIGGASKLLKHFIRIYNPKSIVSYSDRRCGRGNLYKKLGFHRVSITDPSYFYVKGTKIVNKHKLEKSELLNLIPAHYNSNLTESEMMSNAGYYRCYDCGNYVWSLIV